jgi:hypothetical protein
LKAALVIFRPESYVATDLRAKAAEFDPAIFREKIQKVIDEQLAAKSSLPN